MKQFFVWLLSKVMFKAVARGLIKALVKSTKTKVDDNFYLLFEAIEAGDTETITNTLYIIIKHYTDKTR